MLFKKLVLHNIRSYGDAEINFSEGKTLIAGDIGAGKSTMLMAIEFALFGLLKGDLSGSMLLRHGERDGFVELTFEVNGNDVTLRRVLKRTAKSIEQDAGFIIKNGRKEDATATELKAQVLELLGYPEDLMTKSKSLLFRYTVYTPQEDMKRILLGDADERLNIIRRIFGIDKYKRVRENAEIYTRQVREQMRELLGRTIDLGQKKERLSIVQAEMIAAQNEVVSAEPVLTAVKSASQDCRNRLQGLEEQRMLVQEIKRKSDMIAVGMQQRESEKILLVAELKHVDERIAVVTKEIAGLVVEDSAVLKEELIKKNNDLSLSEKERFALASKTAGAGAVQKISQTTVQKISLLDTCPLCLQKVSSAHKQSIVDGEQAKIMSAQQESHNNNILQKEIEAKIVCQKSEIERMQLKERDNALLRMRQQGMLEKMQQREAIIMRMQKSDKESAEKKHEKDLLDVAIQKSVTLEQEYTYAKSVLDAALIAEKKAEVAYSVAQEKARFAVQQQKLLAAEVAEKEAVVKQQAMLKKVHDWIRELFCPLVEQIEKQVLGRVYGQFNDLFRQWFSLLVDDDMFSARLDAAFAPVLQQNGFDTVAENLSGGEKTACALAYRLALNKVINDVLALVQTKEVLILDEPTDGFSDEQLDKVRDVLNHVGLKQIIMVSHERKVEGFVDAVIRVHKQGHISSAHA